jgi:hypothetical protein
MRRAKAAKVHDSLPSDRNFASLRRSILPLLFHSV